MVYRKIVQSVCGTVHLNQICPEWFLWGSLSWAGHEEKQRVPLHMYTGAHWYWFSYGKSQVSQTCTKCFFLLFFCFLLFLPFILMWWLLNHSTVAKGSVHLCPRGIVDIPAYPASEAALSIIKTGATRQQELYYPWFTYVAALTKDWFPSFTSYIIQNTYNHIP